MAMMGDDLEDPAAAAARGLRVVDPAPWSTVLAATWPAVIAAFVSYAHGVLVVCLLPFIPAEEVSTAFLDSGEPETLAVIPNNAAGDASITVPGGPDETAVASLSQRLVFVNLFANLVGRLFAVTRMGAWCGASRSPLWILALACVRLLLLAPFGYVPLRRAFSFLLLLFFVLAWIRIQHYAHRSGAAKPVHFAE